MFNNFNRNFIYYLKITDVFKYRENLLYNGIKTVNEKYGSLEHIYYSYNMYYINEFDEALLLSNKLDLSKDNEIYTNVFNNTNKRQMIYNFNKNRFDNICLSLDDSLKNVNIDVDEDMLIGITHKITLSLLRNDYVLYKNDFYDLNIAKSFLLGIQFANIPDIYVKYNINYIDCKKI